jgi:pimeloyl-ACP methyl ester carboxylesterase
MAGFATILAAMLLAATPSSGVETEVEAPGPAGALRGTMLAPAGDARAVVLIVPGSGAIDRDGNNSMGISAAPYRLLAEGLAERGIATVRIDKRGLRGSAAAVPDANAVSISDYAADVHQWVRETRASTGAPCIWVLGHSEGGLVSLLAGQEPEGICGLVLVAATGRPLGTVLREQLRANPANAPLLDQAMAAIDSLEGGQRFEVGGMHPALMPLFAPQLQDYQIDVMSYDPAELIAAMEVPVLIVHAQRDLQVGEVDARRLAGANAAARLVLIPDANHVLKVVATDDRAANAATYSDPSLPLAPDIVEPIAAFVTASSAGGEAD